MLKLVFSIKFQETMEETGSESASGDHEKTMKRRRYNRKRISVVNPDENFYFHWLMVLTFCILYNLWTLIVRQSFPELQVLIEFPQRKVFLFYKQFICFLGSNTKFLVFLWLPYWYNICSGYCCSTKNWLFGTRTYGKFSNHFYFLLVPKPKITV